MPEVTPTKYLVTAGWDDVPHLSEQTKAELLAATPPHLREARSKGTPALGSGAVYPIDETLIACPAMPIPRHWAQIIGIDFGYDHPTAAARLAWDRDADVIYVTHAYRRQGQTPLLNAAPIKAWGDWIPVAWPHDGLQHDKGGSCEQIKEQYAGHGLNMLPEKASHAEGGNGVEAGIMEILERMESGRFYVFANLLDWFMEFRLYHRADGKIVKVIDDLLDATRYAVMMLRFAETMPRPKASVPLWKQKILKGGRPSAQAA